MYNRRGIKKRVVEIPMKNVEGTNTPPSDSWAWRKYGQKPIKGSPYPRYINSHSQSHPLYIHSCHNKIRI